MHVNYYEGILQVRNPSREVVEFVLKFEKGISQEKRVPNGIDYYFRSQQTLKSLGNRLQRIFGGELKISATLHTRSRQTSKDLYRVNVLFRLPKFKKGDEIGYKGEKIKITSLGKKVFARNENGKKLILRYSDLDK